MSPPCYTSPYEELGASNGPREQFAPPGPMQACFPLEGMDCTFLISHSSHFTPALVLLEGLFQEQQLLKRLGLYRSSQRTVAVNGVEESRSAAP